MNIRRFIRNWSLPLSLAAGASGYFVCRCLSLSSTVRDTLTEAVDYIQPTLIFMMLTLTFCRIRPSDMRLRGWQWWLMALQAGTSVLLCMLNQVAEDAASRLFLQSAMLCFLCPTATAAAVVTTKLGGDAGTLTTYTMLVNLLAAVLVSSLIPIVNPMGGIGFWLSFWMIVRRVFPLLIFPLLIGFGIRRFFPSLLRRLTSVPDLPFHLWLIALSLAIAVTTRIVVHTGVTAAACCAVAAGSALACAVQFAAGRSAGRRYGDAVTAGQSCGQKNTILAIWVGSAFLDPLTALAGGLYSVWQNVYNSWQLFQRNRQKGVA